MSGATDTYCVLSQPATAMYGRPTTLFLAITNTSASTAYTITSVSVWATSPRGQTAVSCRIQQPQIPVNGTTDVAASGTFYLPIGAQFYGLPVTGTPNKGPENFLVTAQVMFSDLSSISCSPLPVALADPVWGLNPGSPPNATAVVSSLNFSTPANSGLRLLGWV